MRTTTARPWCYCYSQDAVQSGLPLQYTRSMVPCLNIERYTVFGAFPVTLELLGLSLEKRQEKDMEERENNEDMP